MNATIRQKILLTLMNRHVLIAANVILIGIIMAIISEVTELVLTPHNDVEEMVHMCNGIAIILYGYGVAIEFRSSLMKNLNLYPAFFGPLQEETDRLCHAFGIYFLLLGLVQEILVHIVVMRSRVLDIRGNETYVFAICIIIQSIVTVLLFVLNFQLITTARRVSQRGDQDALEEDAKAS